MVKSIQKRTAKIENNNIMLNTAWIIIFISTTTIVISFVYLIIRRWILITDSSIRAYGISGFISDRAINELLPKFTKSFDSIQAIAMCTLLVGFILVLIAKKDKNRKYLIALITTFSMLTVLNVVRSILIHRGPEHYILLGANFDFSYYYDCAFFIYSTDILRIAITLLLVISILFFIVYLRQIKQEKTKISFIAPVLLGIFLFFYIIIVIVGNVLYNNTDEEVALAIMYYIYYSFQTMLQIGNVIAFASLAKRAKLFSI